MIKTESKDKLAHWLSYPIGAEAINAALGDLPVAKLIRLWFYDHLSTDDQTKVRSNEAWRILQIYHSPTAKYYEEYWGLDIYPVTAINRALAKQLLLEQVLPKVRLWLREDRTEVWLQEYHRLEFQFDPLDKKIMVTEL